MKNNQTCQGACLPHCYNFKIVYIILGFFIGILSYILIEKIINKYKEDRNPE